MNVRFVSQNLEWTDHMKACVRTKIVQPLTHALKSDDFELSVHYEFERKRRLTAVPRFEMWVVLQTFDGRNNQVIRCEGLEFTGLVNEVSHSMRERLREAKRPRFFARGLLMNPFRSLPAEKTA